MSVTTPPSTVSNTTESVEGATTHASPNTALSSTSPGTTNPFHDDHAITTTSAPSEATTIHVDHSPEPTQAPALPTPPLPESASPISSQVPGSTEPAGVYHPEHPVSSSPPQVSPSSQAAQASPALLPSQTEQTPDAPVSNQLAALRSMFPDFDDGLLQSVLESVGNDEARAIDVLLGMSDPEYRSDVRPEAQHTPMTQTELDEQFARQLLLQDEEQHNQAQWRAQHQQPPQHSGQWSGPGQQQYQQQQAPGAQRDTMAEFQDQFTKFAETGKKTIGTFFNKVKAKINEMDQPRPANAGQSSSMAAPQRQQPLNQQPQSYLPPASQPPATATAGRGTNPPWVDQAEQYGNPQSSPGHDQSLGGYDVSSGSHPAPANAASNATPPPPQTNSGAPIDASKIGLLPKRPVSLIASNPPTTQRPADSDDELEYAESPFEEHRPTASGPR